MLQLLITIPIALFVKTRRTALMWSLIVPICMTVAIMMAIGGRYLSGAVLMVAICPVVTMFIQFIKTRCVNAKQCSAEKVGEGQ